MILIAELWYRNKIKTDITTVGIRRAVHATPLYPQKAEINFADKQWSLGRYSSLAD
jgi:hypothetical protein